MTRMPKYIPTALLSIWWKINLEKLAANNHIKVSHVIITPFDQAAVADLDEIHLTSHHTSH